MSPEPFLGSIIIMILFIETTFRNGRFDAKCIIWRQILYKICNNSLQRIFRKTIYSFALPIHRLAEVYTSTNNIRYTLCLSSRQYGLHHIVQVVPTVACWFANNRGESERNADIFFSRSASELWNKALVMQIKFEYYYTQIRSQLFFG